MFTGIIKNTTKILSIDAGAFTLENPFGDDLEVGQSIAHDGACMSITEFDKQTYKFFAMEESFKKTNFGSKKVGDEFNLELCMKASTRVDGHFVSGHIDTKGKMVERSFADDDSLFLGIEFDKKWSDYTIEKGSIALNGVSLTIVDTKPGYISVWLIPITQEETNLGDLEVGDSVNIEFDMLGKYMVKYAKNMHEDSRS